MIAVKDVPYVLGYDGVPFLVIGRFFDISIDHTLDANSVMTLLVRPNTPVEVEHQIVYRGARYVVTESAVSRGNHQREIIAEIAYTVLSKQPVTYKKDAVTLEEAATAILDGSGWSLNIVDDPAQVHDIDIEDVSRLASLRQLATLYDRDLRFDTINRRVSYRASGFNEVNFNFRYGRNLQDIERRDAAPAATVIYPYGNDGLDIKSVNDGLEYLEDFSWYTSKGMTLEAARADYRRVETYTDSRFGKASSLKKDAQKRLSKLARPQRTYIAKASTLDSLHRVGDYGYIYDEELNIRDRVAIVRLLEKNNPLDSELELDTPRKGIVDILKKGWVGTGVTGGGKGWSGTKAPTGGGGDPGTPSPVETVGGANEGEVVVGSEYVELVDVTLRLGIDANLVGSFNVEGEASVGGRLDVQVRLNTAVVNTYATNVSQGLTNFSRQFLITNVGSGDQTVRIFAKMSAGTLTIPTGKADLFFQSDALTDGISTGRPDIEYVENVTLPGIVGVVDTCTIQLDVP